MIKAELKNYRQSPRKVRLVADAIRGKSASNAVDILTFMPKRASGPMKKLLLSAIANAEHNHQLSVESLVVKEIRVDKGVTLHRWRARARGSASPINKRSSRVLITLSDLAKKASKKEEVKTEKIEDKKVAKKATTKKVAKTVSKETTKKAPVKKAVKKETNINKK